MELIDKDALVAEIEKQRQLIFPQNTGEMKVSDVPKQLEQGWLNALSWMKKTIDTLEAKEVDLEEEIKLNYNPVDGLEFEEYKRIAKYYFELGLKA